GVFQIVDEELVGHLIAGVALLLDRLSRHAGFAIALAPELHLPHRHVLDVVGLGIDRPARFEHESVEPALAQLLGGPPTADPRSDDDRVVCLGHGYFPLWSSR